MGEIMIRYTGVGVYLGRRGRFTVAVQAGRDVMNCHLHDTGRIDHLAREGETLVYYRTARSLHRRTSCDVVALSPSGGLVVVVDSRVPNAAFAKWYRLVAPWAETVESEKPAMGSRFDFLLSGPGRAAIVEVKGVNKSVGGAGLFPNAPSARAAKHLETLASLARAGLEPMLVFVALRGDVEVFAPDWRVDRAFSRLLCLLRGKVQYHGIVPDVTVEEDSRAVLLRNPERAPVDPCLERVKL